MQLGIITEFVDTDTTEESCGKLITEEEFILRIIEGIIIFDGIFGKAIFVEETVETTFVSGHCFLREQPILPKVP